MAEYDHQDLGNYHPDIQKGVGGFWRRKPKMSIFKALSGSSQESGVSKKTLLQTLKNLLHK